MNIRTRASERWQRVAAGDLEQPPDEDDDLHAWIREVAQRLLDADEEPDAKRRPFEIMKAVELGGPVERYAELDALIGEPQFVFPLIADDGAEHYATGREIVEEARRRGLLRGVYASDDKAALALVRERRRRRL